LYDSLVHGQEHTRRITECLLVCTANL
jgi:hypothetical protein